MAIWNEVRVSVEVGIEDKVKVKVRVVVRVRVERGSRLYLVFIPNELAYCDTSNQMVIDH